MLSCFHNCGGKNKPTVNGRIAATASLTMILTLTATASEKLCQPEVPGYMVTNVSTAGNKIVMLPVAEANAPSSLFITQSSLGLNHLPPVQHYQFIAEKLKASCPNATARLLKQGVENGHAFALYMLGCARKTTVNGDAPEYHFAKSLQGDERFYQAQITFRYKPSNNEMANWAAVFSQITICTTDNSDAQ